jgi:outer membrane protein TolC
MLGTSSSWRYGVRILGNLAVPALVSLTGVALAADPVPNPMPAVAAAPQVLDLQQCRDLALVQQPAIAASRASVNAAVEKKQALDKLRLAALIQRDLPIRRKQAALGIQAGQAALSVAESETLYGVTFSYLSALYANEQLEVADEAIARLKDLLESVDKAVKSGDARKEFGQPQIDYIKTNLFLAQARREEAVEGLARASSALREAMGVAGDCPISLKDNHLTDLNVVPDKEQVVALALARRGELGQAAAAYQLTCFEIEAQKSTFFLSSKTFAIGGDIHATPVPTGENGEHYRPGAVGLEMPAMIAGTRKDRVQQAEAYHERAGAVVEKAHNLIVLDAEQAYLRWLEASKKVPKLREASAAADRASDAYRKNFSPLANGKGTVEEVIGAGLQASNVKLQLNQARYQALIGLAGLELATGGGFTPGFETPR